MRGRASLIAFASVAVAGLVALLIAGASDQRRNAFSLDVPNAIPASVLTPGATACQGPVRPLVAFRGVEAWIAPGAPAAVSMVVRDLRGRRLANAVQTEPELTGPSTTVITSRLDGTVGTGTRVDVCLLNRGPSAVTLLGAAATDLSGRLRVGSVTTNVAVALVFLRAHPRTLLSLVPALFAHAALFKAGWVGTWTFWVLCAGILAAFGLAAGAVALAVRDQVS
jgi:hypothetical protein